MSCKSFLFQLTVLTILLGASASPAAPLSLNSTNSLSATNKIQIPASVFVIPSNANEGRDPFYPESTRFAGGGGNTNSAPVIPAVALTLQGISGTASQKLAIINGRTLAEGEETDLSLSGARVRLRCIEIKTDSVVVEIGGARRELRLRNL